MFRADAAALSGQAQLCLSCKASKCSDVGTGDLGVLTAYETSSMNMNRTCTRQLATASPGYFVKTLPM